MDNYTDLQTILSKHLEADLDRFNRLETKIDRLADTVVALARAEEKLINLEHHRQYLDERLIKIDADVHAAWRTIRGTQSTINTTLKIVSAVGLALLPIIVQVFFR